MADEAETHETATGAELAGQAAVVDTAEAVADRANVAAHGAIASAETAAAMANAHAAQVQEHAAAEVRNIAEETREALEVQEGSLEWLTQRSREQETALSSLSQRMETSAQEQATAQAEILRRLEALTPPPPVETPTETVAPEQERQDGNAGVQENPTTQERQRRQHRSI